MWENTSYKILVRTTKSTWSLYDKYGYHEGNLFSMHTTISRHQIIQADFVALKYELIFSYVCKIHFINRKVIFIMPPLEKGGILFCNCRSVGLWTKHCPPNIFWHLHLINTELSTGVVCCPLNIFWPLHLISSKLGAGLHSMSR